MKDLIEDLQYYTGLNSNEAEQLIQYCSKENIPEEKIQEMIRIEKLIRDIRYSLSNSFNECKDLVEKAFKSNISIDEMEEYLRYSSVFELVNHINNTYEDMFEPKEQIDHLSFKPTLERLKSEVKYVDEYHKSYTELKIKAFEKLVEEEETNEKIQALKQ